MTFEKKSAGIPISPFSQIHYMDHLGVICILMGIPHLFIDNTEYEIAKRYYPGLDAQLLDYSTLSPEYLISHYDVLFLSDYWDCKAFHQKYHDLEKKYQKQIRIVHCPHGFSDKGFYFKKCANEDIVLIYGQNMIDLLKQEAVFEQLHQYVITGNYRLSYFKQHQKIFQHIIQEEILKKFAKQQPIILYAPTWMDLEDSTTFFDAANTILGNLPENYNLIVKLHPRLEYDNTSLFYQITSRFSKRPNILFLKDFPLVYPLLSHVDIYLGDISSIGYDFLYFNKPMFFLNKHRRNSETDRTAYLFRCGIDIKPDAYALIYRIINANLPTDQERFQTIRQTVYQYTFGQEQPFEQIKANIIKAYSQMN